MPAISIPDLEARVRAVFLAEGVNASSAEAAARSLVLAEAQGLQSHGLSRVAQYVGHLRAGRVNREAQPAVIRSKGGAALIDAQEGLAFAACDMATREGIARALEFGVSFVGVTNSHHCGVVVDHMRKVAEAGLIALGFSNGSPAMPMAGGKHSVFSTNPIAAAFPRRGADPLMIDMSLSEVARGKLMVAQKAGKQIPLGWALDAQGNPTTDPAAGMEGFMLPIGAASSAKGAMLALMVELLVSALLGARFSFEVTTFFTAEGNVPRVGQAFIVIDPAALIGNDSYLDRMEVMVSELLTDEDVRLPGARREALLRQSRANGVDVPEAMLESLRV